MTHILNNGASTTCLPSIVEAGGAEVARYTCEGAGDYAAYAFPNGRVFLYDTEDSGFFYPMGNLRIEGESPEIAAAALAQKYHLIAA